MDMFIPHIPNAYTFDQIRDTAPDREQVLKITKISHDDAINSSYKLIIFADDEEKVMQPSYWPEFVACWRFIPPQLRRSGNNPPSACT